MTYDPYQINPTLGAYTSTINPAIGINPLAAALGVSAMSPLGGIAQWGQGYPGVGMHGPMSPQHLQLAAQAAQVAQFLGVQNPVQAALLHQQLLVQAGLQNPYAATILQNPYVQQQNPFLLQNPLLQLQNPLGQQYPFLNPILAPQYGPLLGPQIGGQPSMQYPQIGSPYGPVLAPQGWVGQGGQLGGGQIHPLLQQLISRPFHTPGLVPWAGV
jgi:hypothetical protein